MNTQTNSHTDQDFTLIWRGKNNFATVLHTHTHTHTPWSIEVKLTSSLASHKITPSKTDPLLMVPMVLKDLTQSRAMQYHTHRTSASLYTVLLPKGHIECSSYCDDVIQCKVGSKMCSFFLCYRCDDVTSVHVFVPCLSICLCLLDIRLARKPTSITAFCSRGQTFLF